MNKKIIIPTFICIILCIGHIKTIVKKANFKDTEIFKKMKAAGKKAEKDRAQWIKAKEQAIKIIDELRTIQEQMKVKEDYIKKANIFKKVPARAQLLGLNVKYANKEKAWIKWRKIIDAIEHKYTRISPVEPFYTGVKLSPALKYKLELKHKLEHNH